MPPKAVDWAKEAASLAERMTQPGGTTDRYSDGGASDPDTTNSQLRPQLRSFWKCHGAGFSEWWLALPEADREPFQRALVPFFPAKRGDVRVRMPGATREQDCSTFFLFIPEINLAGLTADGGRGLLDLYEQRVQQARHADELAAQGQRKLLVDDLEVLTLAADSVPQGWKATLQVKAGAAAMDAEVYFLMRQRQVWILTMLLAWGDAYRREVLGRDGKTRALKACGCSQCGAHSGEGGKPLLYCPCGYAVYCSTQCQKVDWPAHKAECKRIRAEFKAAKA
ncbi:hypothetical protein ABPG77_005024 [Micractinium sp. CCAP 211/92]